MSGHEKHYIPHDDLETLSTNLTTLNTSIGTLDTTIQDTLKERYELTVDDTHTVTNGNVEAILFNEALSATKDCFIRRVKILVDHATADPLLLYNSDISLSVGIAATTNAVADQVFGDSRRPAARVFGDDTKYAFSRTWYVNDHKIPANEAILASALYCNIRAGTVIKVVITYVEDVYD